MSVSPISVSSYMSKNDSAYPLREIKAIAEELAKEKPTVVFDPPCIRKKCNWSSVRNEHKFDDASFNPEVFLKDIPNSSPKLYTLLKKISALDNRDEKKYGRKFKHFIFSDIKSGGQGAKMLASAFIATEWALGYRAELKNRDKIADASALPPKAVWGPLELLPNSELKKSNSFYLLSSVSVFDKPISVKLKKDILARFNQRPDNIYGENARIIIMDSGFKEGIDLFDIKYVHIFEPSLNSADQKQVIGRGTRTCGQKGLEFHPTQGWPLEVYLYDLEIPVALRSSLLGSETTQELLMKAMNMDVRLANFGYDIERLSVIGSVDYELNQAVHRFKVDLEADEEEIVLGGAFAGGAFAGGAFAGGAFAGGAFSGGAHRKFGEKKSDLLRRGVRPFDDHDSMVKFVRENYGQYKWDNVKMENLCEEKKGGRVNEWDLYHGGASSIIDFTPTQEFIRHYFKPSVPIKGMLLHHSVGTGKTASAIAAATANFEPEGYTILWVTRTTLKNDIWKNMFDQVANESIRNLIASGETIPADQTERMKLLSKAWRIRPISYKQFSNLVSKQNSYYQRLVKENGEADPLRKTLLIIDEAHKLYGGGDLSSIERPDMEALHNSLMTSYAVSGNDSVRLMLMTATPITENPMELVKLVNLCKPMEHQMPTTFEVFSQQYLDEDGKFSKKGEEQFLDDIAGHISYLNREKDARQFSQPILKRVMVPMVTDAQMKDIKDFDKFVARSDAEAAVLKLQTEAEKVADKLEGELAELDKSRFQNLKELCNDYEEIPKKKCETIVNRNISALVKETKEYVKTVKEQSKKIRSDIMSSKSDRQTMLRDIQNRILKYPELFAKYKTSTYAALRNACSSTIRTSEQFLDAVKEIPEVQELNQRINDYKQEIDVLENHAGISKDVFKRKLKQIKEMLKDKELAPLERSVLELTLRISKKEFRKTMKNESSETKLKTEKFQKEIKAIESDRSKVFTGIRKTIKKMVSAKKKNEKEAKKEMRLLRKTMRIQGKLDDAIEDETVRNIIARREVMIDTELQDVSEEMREKERDKIRKQLEKEEDKQEKAKEKAKEKKEEQERKEREKLEKQREKEAAKAEVKRQKEAAKTKKNQEKVEAKAQAKEEAKRQKEAAKTKKSQK